MHCHFFCTYSLITIFTASITLGIFLIMRVSQFIVIITYLYCLFVVFLSSRNVLILSVAALIAQRPTLCEVSTGNIWGCGKHHPLKPLRTAILRANNGERFDLRYYEVVSLRIRVIGGSIPLLRSQLGSAALRQNQ